MLHGNIYPTAKVHSALSGFFRMENLVALRELSLRFLADETEEELLEFLRSRGSHVGGEVWDTAERIMVAVTGAPGNDTVIRRAARIAARSKADLIGLHVVSSEDGPGRGATDDLQELVVAVGGSWVVVTATEDVAAAIVSAAVDHQITQIVLGTSQHTRWQSLTRGGSIMLKVLRLAAAEGIDVHVIARQVVRAGNTMDEED
jgi:two-component system sensor histidine kinase KdpD